MAINQLDLPAIHRSAMQAQGMKQQNAMAGELGPLQVEGARMGNRLAQMKLDEAGQPKPIDPEDVRRMVDWATTPEMWNQGVDTFVNEGNPQFERYRDQFHRKEEFKALLAAQPNGKEAFTLSRGQTRFGPDGKPVASVAAALSKPTAHEKEVAYYKSIGMPDEWANDVAYGNIVEATDPVSRAPILLNKRTKEQIAVSGQVPAQQPTQPALQPSGELQGQPSEELPAAPVIEGAGGAYGSSGAMTNAVNTFTGIWGIPDIFPDEEKARQGLDAGKTYTGLALSQEFADRDTNLVRDMVLGLLPDPGQFTMGDERAKYKIEAAINLLKADLKKKEAITQNPGQYQPKTVDSARKGTLQLKELIQMWQTVIDKYEGPGVDPTDAPVKYKALD